MSYDWILSKHGRAINGCKILVSKLKREKRHLGYLDYKKVYCKNTRMGCKNVKSNKLPEWEIFIFHKKKMTS